MPYSEITGDLFALDLSAVGHGCNCQGSMGGGIALDFKSRYPDMYREYRRRCDHQAFPLGGFFAWVAGDQVIYNLATQQFPGASATLGAIGSSVRAALADAEGRGLTSLGVPRIGAGIGKLDWDKVAAVLRPAGEESSVNLVVVTKPKLRPASPTRAG